MCGVDALPLAVVEDHLVTHFLGDATNGNNRPAPPGLTQAVIIKESPNPRARPRIVGLLSRRGRRGRSSRRAESGLGVVVHLLAATKDARPSERVRAAALRLVEAPFARSTFVREAAVAGAAPTPPIARRRASSPLFRCRVRLACLAAEPLTMAAAAASSVVAAEPCPQTRQDRRDGADGRSHAADRIEKQLNATKGCGDGTQRDSDATIAHPAAESRCPRTRAAARLDHEV